MICGRIEYRNFRNIENEAIEFDDGINVLYGKNAQGKTNALEGIYVFAQGRSFRTSKERELLGCGSEEALLKLSYRDAARSRELEIKYIRGKKKLCRKNGVYLAKMSEFIGNFRAVLFSPAHLSLVCDGPHARRAFIDAALSQLLPAYMAALQRYNGILAERNALIKNYYANREAFGETIELWSLQLAREAAFISRKRVRYIERLDLCVTELISDMTGGRETARLSYGEPTTEEQYLTRLTENLEREIKFGATLYGTHREDVEITLNGAEARSFCSQGQQRSIALAMKLGEGEISRELTGEYPVFLLDDILSELDSDRRSYIIGQLGSKQVIITSCDDILGSCRKIRVENGKYYG